MKALNAGFWAAAVLAVLSAFLFVYSFSYAYTGPSGDPGPGFFPIWLAGILFALSLLYMIESVRSSQEEVLPRGEALKRIAKISVGLIAFLILLSVAGFLLSSVLFLFFMLYRSYPWHVNLAIALGVTLLAYWLFRMVLSVPLPVNTFGW